MNFLRNLRDPKLLDTINYLKKELNFFEISMNNILKDGEPFIKDQRQYENMQEKVS